MLVTKFIADRADLVSLGGGGGGGEGAIAPVCTPWLRAWLCRMPVPILKHRLELQGISHVVSLVSFSDVKAF